MSAEFTLNAEARQSGKHFSRQARKDMKVPTVVYGPKFKNQNIFIEEKAIKKYMSRRFESTIFTLKSDDSAVSGTKVLIKKIQTHPVTDRPVHLDLYALDMTSKVRVTVVVKFTGTPVGVKEEGGIFQAVTNEVEVECLPSIIPTEIVADVTGLNLNNSLHVSDLALPDGVRAVTPAERTLATVTVYEEEKAADPAATTAAAAPAAAAPAADKAKK